MLGVRENSVQRSVQLAGLLCAFALLFLGAGGLYAKDKKDKPVAAPKKNLLELLDYSKIVWPNPPAITRIRFLSQFYGEKRETKAAEKKSGWMDRLAGATVGNASQNDKLFYQLVRPYGVGVDSKGRVYVVDEKVLAVFIYDADSGQVEMIKNGEQARFRLPTGLTLDDGDQLFVADSAMKHVLVFDKQHKAQAKTRTDDTRRFLASD